MSRKISYLLANNQLLVNAVKHQIFGISN